MKLYEKALYIGDFKTLESILLEYLKESNTSIIFVQSKQSANFIIRLIKKAGLESPVLLSQKLPMERFRRNHFPKILVTTPGALCNLLSQGRFLSHREVDFFYFEPYQLLSLGYSGDFRECEKQFEVKRQIFLSETRDPEKQEIIISRFGLKNVIRTKAENIKKRDKQRTVLVYPQILDKTLKLLRPEEAVIRTQNSKHAAEMLESIGFKEENDLFVRDQIKLRINGNVDSSDLVFNLVEKL